MHVFVFTHHWPESHESHMYPLYLFEILSDSRSYLDMDYFDQRRQTVASVISNNACCGRLETCYLGSI